MADQNEKPVTMTTDDVFNAFINWHKDSPLADQLNAIRQAFNKLVEGSRTITTGLKSWNLGDQVYDVREREGEGWEGPEVMKFSHAHSLITEALAVLKDDSA